ncbi:MAG TPA: nuclear transport factor 2 family protein [Gemmatimonadales bacterium]|nr:nuclear transport factor 2 family protein [Gemmatimonadales bacterium]
MTTSKAAVLALLLLPITGQGDPVEALRQTENRRFAAMVRADTAALGPMLDDGLSYIHSNAMVETKESHLAAIGSRRTVYQALTPVSLSYRLVGELAIGTGIVSAKGSLDGTAFDVTLRVTTVHVRAEGTWRLLAWQSTRIP